MDELNETTIAQLVSEQNISPKRYLFTRQFLHSFSCEFFADFFTKSIHHNKEKFIHSSFGSRTEGSIFYAYLHDWLIDFISYFSPQTKYNLHCPLVLQGQFYYKDTEKPPYAVLIT